MEKAVMKTTTSTPLSNDNELLEQIMNGAHSASDVYQPGEYWKDKTENAALQLRKLGLENFRSSQNSAITSYGDNPILYAVNDKPSSLKDVIKKFITTSYPFDRIWSYQVELTKGLFRSYLSAVNGYFSINPRVSELLQRYPINFDTTIGGCEIFFESKGLRVAHLYLSLLDTLDHMNAKINLKEVNSLIEIGGGFGVNVDLQI
jgi:hypothetical protein